MATEYLRSLEGSSKSDVPLSYRLKRVLGYISVGGGIISLVELSLPGVALFGLAAYLLLKEKNK